MRTSIELPDPMFNRARTLAQQRGTTMKSLIEEGLRHVLDSEGPTDTGEEVRLLTYGTGGMRPEFAEGDWNKLAEVIYPDPSL